MNDRLFPSVQVVLHPKGTPI